MDYLRNRPFLVVELSQRPAPDTNTKKAGWQKEQGAMQTFEKVSFLDRIKDTTKYAVIIDIINSAVIRNTGTATENEILATYLSKYREKVTQSLTIWAQKEAQKEMRI